MQSFRDVVKMQNSICEKCFRYPLMTLSAPPDIKEEYAKSQSFER